MEQAQQVGECLHAYGIHSFTVQPELMTILPSVAERAELGSDGHASGRASDGQQTGRDMDMSTKGMTCRIKCQEGVCGEPQCCD